MHENKERLNVNYYNIDIYMIILTWTQIKYLFMRQLKLRMRYNSRLKIPVQDLVNDHGQEHTLEHLQCLIHEHLNAYHMDFEDRTCLRTCKLLSISISSNDFICMNVNMYMCVKMHSISLNFTFHLHKHVHKLTHVHTHIHIHVHVYE